MRRVWLWWSSGKDSAWALQLLREDPEVAVERLITTVTPTFGRVAIHGTRVSVLEAQASAVGVPVQSIELPYPCTNAEYEAAVRPVLQEAVSGPRFGRRHGVSAPRRRLQPFDSVRMDGPS